MITDGGTQPSTPSGSDETMEGRAAALTQAIGGGSWDATDLELVIRARSGDLPAFAMLFERYRKMVFRFVSHLASGRDDAEDITQECFVRAFENLHRFRDECRFTTWLLRIAVNLCTDRARMRSRRTALEDQEAAGALLWMTTGENSDPVANIVAERRADAVRRALNALPEHHKLMIVLRDVEQKDYDEITQILGCTYGGAKLRVLRARRALRDRLQPLLEVLE